MCPSTEPGAPAGAFRTSCGLEVGGQISPVFPILMPADWQHPPTQVCRPLIVGPQLPGIPQVALAYLMWEQSPGADTFYIRTERVKAISKTVADFEQEALHNLALRPASWGVMEPAPGARLAICANDALAAERILDGAFIREAQELLDTDSLMVAIPARGQLLATPLAPFVKGERHATVFKAMARQCHDAAGERGITTGMFIMIKGVMNSMAEYG